MFTYGMEREHFVRRNGTLALVPDRIPRDELPILAEARGEPASNPVDAAFLLLSDEAKLKRMLPAGYELDTTPLYELGVEPDQFPLETFRKAVWSTGKPGRPATRRNLYNKEFPVEDFGRYVRAGLHIHFKNLQEDPKSGRRYNGFIDFAQMIRTLDDYFENEIRAARRVEGWYELKYDSGLEYRSLPNDVDVEEVAWVIQNNKNLLS